MLSLSGCLEHNFRITVLPRDRVDLSFELRGDRTDLDDQYDLLPDSARWSLTRSVEENEDETVYTISGQHQVENLSELGTALNWRRSSADSLGYAPEFQLVKKRGLFGSAYVFSGWFPARDFDKLYGDMWAFIPPECRVLEDDKAQSNLSIEELAQLEDKFGLGALQWNLERYNIRLKTVWEDLKKRGITIPDTSETVFSIAMAGWNDDVRLYLNALDIPNPKTVNLEWWEDLRPLFLGHLVDLVGLDNVDLAWGVAEAYERKYQISKDLKDDVYHVNLELPGRIVSTDGQRNDEDRLVWEIQGSGLLNTEMRIKAESFAVSYWRIGITIFIAMVLIRLATRRFFTRARRSL